MNWFSVKMLAGVYLMALRTHKQEAIMARNLSE